MKKALFIPLFFTLLWSCKKTEDVDPGPSGTPISNVTPSDSSNYQALFSCSNVFVKNAGVYSPAGKSAIAYYSSQPVINEAYYSQNLQYMGNVMLDSVTFKEKSIVTNYYYNDTTGTPFSLPYNWNVSGYLSIATFSYSNGNPPPIFTATANIPDSISASAGFTVSVNGTSNCDLIRVFITGGTASTVFPNKLFSGNDTTIHFSPADLLGLTSTTNGYLSVQLYKDHYRTIGGKRINFRSGVQYNNYHLKIKP